MPDERFFHKRLGHSAKVNSLSDFEFRVWAQYELSADDCGVMRNAAVAVQADNDALAAKPSRAVQRALDRLVDVGLLLAFEHQGRGYVCQGDWQDFQRIRFPRATVHPCPPDETLQKCSSATVALFRLRHRKTTETPPEDSGEGSGMSPVPARAGGREWLTANGNGKSSEGGTEETKTEIPKRAGAFCQWYEDTHQRLFGIGYMGTQKDYQTALQLCEKFTDAELRDGALVWFGMDDDFAKNGTRSIPKFASRITGCLQAAKARGIA